MEFRNEQNDEGVFQVKTRSSTQQFRIKQRKNGKSVKKQRKSKHRRRRSSSSGSDQISGSSPESQGEHESEVPEALKGRDTAEGEPGVQTKEHEKLRNKDISGNVQEMLAPGPKPALKKQVRFDDTPVMIFPPLIQKVDQYDILQDIKNQKANVTIGQLLHDNVNYQKQVREGWITRRKKRFKLPPIAVNFTAIEDYGAPDLSIDIDGCMVPRVLVDGGSGCNLMLESTAFDLGFTSFETTPQILRMADQSKVVPIGRLSAIPTKIGEAVYPMNYVILRVNCGRPFPVLLGRPWLYAAEVLVDWGKREFIFGDPVQRIPWKTVAALGETGESEEGYTSESEEPEEEITSTYLVSLFENLIEEDFGFTDAVPEQGEEIPVADANNPDPDVDEVESGLGADRSLGQIDIPLTSEWVREKISSGNLPTNEVEPKTGIPLQWGDLPGTEIDEDRVKPVVSPLTYRKLYIDEERFFYVGKTIVGKELEAYRALLTEFADIFAWSPLDVPGISPELAEHRIDLIEGAVPVRQRQYRLNPRYNQLVKEDLDKLLEAGFIYPVTNTEWVSSIVVVPKKVGADGKFKIRICQDFRKLNAVTQKDYFPLPFTDIILDHVAGREVMSFLDGFSGYNQISIRFADQLKTTFTTQWGTFAFSRMPFGLCNAPGTFQRAVMDIFRDFLNFFMEVFLDDFAVFGKRTDHLGHLRKTFERCRETKLRLHPGKCFLGVTEGTLLGHVVSIKGVQVDIDKVTAILCLAAPCCVREVRGFLGAVGYYRRFIEAYAKIAIPLTELLKKDVEYDWTADRQAAFEELKRRLAVAPILAPPNWEIEFHVTLDASGFCVSAILWQYGEKKSERPIHFASRQMSEAEKKYTTTEREALAVVYACKKFRHYLLGYKVIFHTDHNSLKHLVNKADLSGRVARWILLLQEFDYEVQFKPGKSNANADYLSRMRGESASADLDDEFPDEFPETRVTPGVEEIPVLQVSPDQPSTYADIKEFLISGTVPEGLNREEKSIFVHKAGPYTLVKNVLFKLGADDSIRRCVEEDEKQVIMEALHSGPSGGHFAAGATVTKIRNQGYWWPTMARDVRQFVQSCDPCQRSGAPRFRNHWPLTPIIPLAPFAKWGVDFVGPVNPTSRRRKRHIIIATDYATKWAEAKAVPANDAEAAADFLWEQVILRFGAPLELVSDRGLHFLNDTIVALTQHYNIQHRKTTPYNPKANGAVERTNGTVVRVLGKVISVHQRDWDEKLPAVIHAYNTTHKETTGRSPFYLVYGRIPVAPVELEVETFRVLIQEDITHSESLEQRFEEIEDLEEAREEALERNEVIQAKRKEAYDKKLPPDQNIRKHDLVLLYDSRYKKFPGKLKVRWMGPYRVEEVFPNGSLQLVDLQGAWLDTRVNGSRVKKYLESQD